MCFTARQISHKLTWHKTHIYPQDDLDELINFWTGEEQQSQPQTHDVTSTPLAFAGTSFLPGALDTATSHMRNPPEPIPTSRTYHYDSNSSKTNLLIYIDSSHSSIHTSHHQRPDATPHGTDDGIDGDTFLISNVR